MGVRCTCVPCNHIITVMSQIGFERSYCSSCIKSRDESVIDRICAQLCHLPLVLHPSAHTDVHLPGVQLRQRSSRVSQL